MYKGRIRGVNPELATPTDEAQPLHHVGSAAGMQSKESFESVNSGGGTPERSDLPTIHQSDLTNIKLKNNSKHLDKKNHHHHHHDKKHHHVTHPHYSNAHHGKHVGHKAKSGGRRHSGHKADSMDVCDNDENNNDSNSNADAPETSDNVEMGSEDSEEEDEDDEHEDQDSDESENEDDEETAAEKLKANGYSNSNDTRTLTQQCSLVAPSEVQITLNPALVAEPVLTESGECWIIWWNSYLN